VDVLDAAAVLPKDRQPAVQELQLQLESYFAALSHQLGRAKTVIRQPPLAELQEVVEALLAAAASPLRERGLGAAAGLQRNLLLSKMILQPGATA